MQNCEDCSHVKDATTSLEPTVIVLEAFSGPVLRMSARLFELAVDNANNIPKLHNPGPKLTLAEDDFDAQVHNLRLNLKDKAENHTIRNPLKEISRKTSLLQRTGPLVASWYILNGRALGADLWAPKLWKSSRSYPCLLGSFQDPDEDKGKCRVRVPIRSSLQCACQGYPQKRPPNQHTTRRYLALNSQHDGPYITPEFSLNQVPTVPRAPNYPQIDPKCHALLRYILGGLG